MLEIGTPAPDFELPNQHGQLIRLSVLLQKGPLVLYFYPKNETPGCTKEACGFRDSYEAFTDAGATVVGVSADNVDSHHAFAARYGLPFVLLSDTTGKVRKSYQVKKTLGIFPGRVTYVIDADGLIRQAFSSQLRALAHIDQALVTVRSLEEG